MDPITIGAIVAGGTGVANAISSISGNKKARKAQAKENAINRQFSIDQTNLAYERNLEQWYRQNEYNTPSAQIGRLVDAGLNPNLYAGGSMSNTSGTSPTAGTASYDHRENRSSDFSSTFEAAAAAGMNLLGLQNLRAQNDLLKAQTRNVQAQTEKTGVDTQRASFDLSFLEDTRSANKLYASARAGTESFRESSESQRSRLLFTQANIAEETLPQAKELIQVELDNAKRQGHLIDQNTLYKIQQTLAVQLENQLAEYGVRSSDVLGWRIVARAMKSFFPDVNF